MDTIRVLRVLEYVGPRDVIERHLRDCIQGHRTFVGPDDSRMEVRAATIGLTADIIEMGKIEQMLPPVTQQS